MIKTEHILYINSNTRYARSKGDGVEFEYAIEKLNNLGNGPFLSLHESICMKDYIVGMYPELEKALDFFDKEFYKHPNGAKTDELMHAQAKLTMKKFGLASEYDFDCEPNKEQLQQLNERIKPKQKSDSIKFAPGFLKDLAHVVIDVCDDYRQANQFLSTIHILNGIVSEKYPEDLVRKDQDSVNGVKMGLEFLSMKRQGLIDDNLNITDIDKFCASNVMKEFAVGDKIYDLSENFKEACDKSSNSNKILSSIRKYIKANWHNK